jgi:hypothetical protein
MLVLHNKFELSVCSEADEYHQKYYGIIRNTHASAFMIITTADGLVCSLLWHLNVLVRNRYLSKTTPLLVTDILQK